MSTADSSSSAAAVAGGAQQPLHRLEHGWSMWYIPNYHTAAKQKTAGAPTATAAGAAAAPAAVVPAAAPATAAPAGSSAATGAAAPAAAGSWEDFLIHVQQVSTVEEFWAVFNTVKKPSGMDLNASYGFFKADVKPMWEDPANRNGGKWLITLTTPADLYRLDNLWEELLMSVIGGYLEEGEGDQIVGCMLAKRRNMAKISLWTKDKTAESLLMPLGHRMHQVMGLEPSITVEYHHHDSESHEPALRIKLA